MRDLLAVTWNDPEFWGGIMIAALLMEVAHWGKAWADRT